MRSTTILLIAVAVLFLGVTNALATVKNANPATMLEAHSPELNNAFNGKTSLRSLKEVATAEFQGKEDEERAISFSFLERLNKYIPGTKAFTQASAARKAIARAKKLEKAAKKKELENLFNLKGIPEHQLTTKYKQWEAAKISSKDVTNGVHEKMKISEAEAVTIGNDYQAWINTKLRKALLP
ncbi:putative secreted RxLR effector peptide protein [Phytophthora cinnamomi]|uniref:putative secreted RxLR effector peptide protein n=1 Tax=Phytophthora cinnamomi TaxID=4785 RepID=UPI002A2E722E|nr:putative secreted RxLR effector peptide protein [Phytophthora cinnamomi]KAJ8554803.1 hypothetical protein ON010_g9680 [Phytophthora cinnamomi]